MNITHNTSSRSRTSINWQWVDCVSVVVQTNTFIDYPINDPISTCSRKEGSATSLLRSAEVSLSLQSGDVTQDDIEWH